MKKKHAIFSSLVLFAVIALASSLWNYRNASANLRKTFMAEQENLLASKARDAEDLLRQIYEVARTIANLPSVRSVTQPNLPATFEENVDKTKFANEGVETVQQLYNNIASRGASEIYFVRQGFASRRDKPFFMFDSLILRGSEDAPRETKEEHSADYPEESEEAEYNYYPKQLAFFAQNYPRFTFKNLEDIPFIASPVMRTCDNTQYQSKSAHNERDAFGILFSVPVYANNGDFSGIISIIVRANIFEALLLNIPFLVVTEDDKREAARLGFSMPAKAGRFVLRDDAFGIEIFDRRNPSLPSVVGDKNRLVLKRKLAKITLSNWELSYLGDTAKLDTGLFQLRNTLFFQLLGILLITGFGCFFVLSGERQKLALARGIAQAATKISAVAEAFNSGCSSVDNTAHALTAKANTEASTIEKISATMVELSATVAQTAKNARVTKDKATEAAAAANEGSEAVRNTVMTTRSVANLTKEIDKIVLQTNLLALNASVEAARAGEAGAGFALVAEEVRNLAMRSGAIARQIGEVAEKGTAAAERAGDMIEQILSQTQETSSLVNEIEAACTEQDRGIQETTTAVQLLKQSVRNLTIEANKLTGASSELAGRAEELSDIIESFKSSRSTS